MNRILIACLMVAVCSCKPEVTNRYVEGKGVIAHHAMVVSAHPEASRIGASIMKAGGNAVDAAVATEFALAVCYPEAGNIGGGGFMVIRNTDGTCAVIDYRETAPANASRNMFLDEHGEVVEGLSLETFLSAGIPGTVDGMIRAHKLYGRLDFREIIQPSIDLASAGFPVTEKQAADLNRFREQFIDRNPLGCAFVRDSIWQPGDTLVQQELAATLERIRDKGREGFYSGITAGLILKASVERNGIFTPDDLEGYRSVVREPITGDYRGYTIITVPPPSSGGIILLQLLKMTEPFPLGKWGFSSEKTIHLAAEAERRAFADRAEHLGDPAYMKVSPAQLIHPGYLAMRMKDFDPAKASVSSMIVPGKPAYPESDETTHYSVVDQDGNAVSATTTLNGTFGSGIVAAGFLLNNQMDDFSVKPGVPNMYGLVGGEVNSIAPGKKILSSMTPVIVEKDGKLFLVAGSPGGSTIPTTVYQVISNIIDHDIPVSEAVDTARFHHQWLPDEILAERDRFDTLVEGKLRNIGHGIRWRTQIGSVSAIMILPDGRRSGGADRRGDNTSCGF